MPAVQLTTHVKSSTLYGRSYGRKSKFFRLDGLLLLFCIIMGLRSASSAIIATDREQWNSGEIYIGLSNLTNEINELLFCYNDFFLCIMTYYLYCISVWKNSEIFCKATLLTTLTLKLHWERLLALYHQRPQEIEKIFYFKSRISLFHFVHKVFFLNLSLQTSMFFC